MNFFVEAYVAYPMKKSCQDLEKNLGKIFSRSCKNLARNQAIQDFRMDLEQESCKIRKILASPKSWHGFGTDFLPTCQILKRLGKILQDIFDRVPQFMKFLTHDNMIYLPQASNVLFLLEYGEVLIAQSCQERGTTDGGRTTPYESHLQVYRLMYDTTEYIVIALAL